MPAVRTSGRYIAVFCDTVAWIVKRPGISKNELLELSGTSQNSLELHLEELMRAGLVYRKLRDPVPSRSGQTPFG